MNDYQNERILFSIKLMVLRIQQSMYFYTIQSLVKCVSLSFESQILL